MNKQRHSVDGSIGHQVRNTGVMTNDTIGRGTEHFREDLKPLNGDVGYRREGFDLIRNKVVEGAKFLKTTVHANSYEVLSIGVGIGSLLGYLAALRWVCDRF